MGIHCETQGAQTCVLGQPRGLSLFLSFPLSLTPLPACLFLSPSVSLCLPIAPSLSVSLCPSLAPSFSVSLPSLRQRGSKEPHPGPRGPLETLAQCLHPTHTLPFPLPGDPHVVQMTTLALEFIVSSRITGCSEHIRAERVG